MGIKITLATGETHSLPFDALSTLTVSTSRVVEPTVVVQDAQSFTDVAAVEVVADDAVEPQPVDADVAAEPEPEPASTPTDGKKQPAKTEA